MMRPPPRSTRTDPLLPYTTRSRAPATPTNLIAIGGTGAAVWRQEKLANQARDIAALGKELYSRIATMGEHIVKVGRNLDQAAGAYNAFVGSFEDRVLTQARKFELLDVETSGKEIPELPVVERSEEHTSELQSLMRRSY